MDFRAMQDLMDRLTAWRIPGNAISVWKDGREIFTWQSGYADMENKLPMTPEHFINVYSCSKVTTVTAALQLYEKGYFLLDDPVSDFIPEFGQLTVRREDGQLEKAKNPMTMRQLFTMTSGLNYDCGSESIRQAVEATGGKADTLTVAKYIAREPLCFEPGESWQYSLSHDVLAAVVSAISGKKFRDYVRENIFEPLGMENSMYHNAPVLDKMAQQYRFEEAEGRAVKVGKGVC